MSPSSPMRSGKSIMAVASIVVAAIFISCAVWNARSVAYSAVKASYPAAGAVYGPRIGISIGNVPVVRAGVDGPLVRCIVDLAPEWSGFRVIRKICWKKEKGE